MFRRLNFDMYNPFTAGQFTARYQCYSVSMYAGADRSDMNKGGKILLPPSALDALTRFHVIYPMLFQLTNPDTKRSSHAGVLEFIAEEGRCYLPNWMMRYLQLEESDLIDVFNKQLPVATWSKFQPQSVDFLDITNAKAVLENALRNFACLTKNDLIAIDYNKKIYELLVLETRPADAVSIIECDMNVEFEAPVGYKDPAAEALEQSQKEEIELPPEEVSFAGAGKRLDGKIKKRDKSAEGAKEDAGERVVQKPVRGKPDYDYQVGSLTFDRRVIPISDRMQTEEEGDNENAVDAGFQGKGSTLSH